MRMWQGVRTGLGHGGVICVLQTQFSSFFLFFHIVIKLSDWRVPALKTLFYALNFGINLCKLL